jgi:hypothetical protein
MFVSFSINTSMGSSARASRSPPRQSEAFA